MNTLTNMKVSMKLGVLILVAFLSLGIVGFTGYYYLNQASKDIAIMYEKRLIPVRLSVEIASFLRTANGNVLELMLTTDEAKNLELKKAIEERAQGINQNMDSLKKMHLDAKADELLAKMEQAQQKYRAARGPILELALQNKNAEAYVLYSATLEPRANEYVGSVRDYTVHIQKISEQMNADIQAAEAKAIQILIGCILVACIILGFFGWMINKMISHPLRLMVAFCGELAAGDFREKPRKVSRKDEIGQVADALANMRSNLRGILQHVNESTEHVAASSEELTASSEQSAQAANQVAASITDVANGANKQLVAANEASDVVSQMSASIQQVAANTNLVAEQSAQAAGKAKEGGASVEKAVAQMVRVEETVNASASVVAKLGERSKEIGQIVDTISGIAGQTNLLALNAAIEAARAGEQGRGFAVVAEEVRKLAEQSQEAAGRIANMIGEIQGDTGKAVSAMNEGTREVKTGAEVVSDAGDAFQEIVKLVSDVSGQIMEISAAIQQMASGSQQIVETVKTIDGLSKSSAAEAQSVSAATEEQLASMEEIASASQTLASLAQDLQKEVSKFQI
ncbi:methyl-accepting chemotaxis protein [Anaeromusa acidaminophila]|uniref:methyl-accepting chemotaxis protein n=1 Tax=Anaeromusa acidaminophila TaxID=81464 RepID=UPI0003652E10|nr:methyl-accepting chemotaxis protein [Anaeromusa acidaminophila]